tara:strand:- start:482 stop:637 length:156 start_codon:yes stop_codon:yes gene_type:complete
MGKISLGFTNRMRFFNKIIGGKISREISGLFFPISPLAIKISQLKGAISTI